MNKYSFLQAVMRDVQHDDVPVLQSLGTPHVNFAQLYPAYGPHKDHMAGHWTVTSAYRNWLHATIEWRRAAEKLREEKGLDHKF